MTEYRNSNVVRAKYGKINKKIHFGKHKLHIRIEKQKKNTQNYQQKCWKVIWF